MGRLKITRFGGKIIPDPKEHQDLKLLLEQCDYLYPGIHLWYKKKVVSGLNLRERTAYVVYEGDQPVGAAVTKLGVNAKLCSMRVLPEAEGKGYGSLLMALCARDMRNHASAIHFTIPSHIWEEKHAFFKLYGFKVQELAGHQYRLFDEELTCNAQTRDVWTNVIKTVPAISRKVTINGYGFDYDLVMSIRPVHARSIVDGQKKIEIRRRFSERWIGSKALVYSTNPERSFIGSFRITNVVAGEPAEIWESFGAEIGCTKEEYANYTKGATKVYAIVVSDNHRFRDVIPATQVSKLMKRDLTVPQAYSRITEENTLGEVASICTLLQSGM